MTITFQLPDQLEESLRRDGQDLNGEAREAFLIDLYRRHKLSHLALSQVLGIDRFETDDVLQNHNVIEDLGTLEDYLADAGALQELRASKT